MRHFFKVKKTYCMQLTFKKLLGALGFSIVVFSWNESDSLPLAVPLYSQVEHTGGDVQVGMRRLGLHDSRPFS